MCTILKNGQSPKHANSALLTQNAAAFSCRCCILRVMKWPKVFLAFSFACSMLHAQQTPLYRDTQQPLEKRLDDLMSRLTVEEKAQVLNHKGSTVKSISLRADQWNQCLNGVKWDKPTTMFPVCIAMSATWNEALVHDLADVLSDEARAIYNGWHLNPKAGGEHKGLIYRAPVINIGRNPYWGRNHEVWGEDPFLTGRLGVAYVKGLQGDDPRYLKVASTLKHYAVNNVETKRTKLNAVVSETMLRDYWFPHFRDCIVEGKAQSVMASYNAVNGVPNNINRWLLTDVMKGEWKLEGFVVSDLGGVKTMVDGHAAGKMNFVDAVAQSLMAGCDFSDKEYEQHIPAAVQQGKLSIERLNDAVRSVLRVRMRLGEFDPFEQVPYSKISPSIIGSEKHRAMALKVAQQSIVLLQNQNQLLPLDAKKLKQVAVLGPLANEVIVNNYCGTHQGAITPLQGIKNRLPAGCSVVTTQGASLGGQKHHYFQTPAPQAIDEKAELEKAVQLAKDSDVAIVVVGTNHTIEQEDRDRTKLSLYGNQLALVKAVYAANPRTVVVQCSAGPITEPWMKENIPAIVQAWWGGEEAGHALADVLLGTVNPAGRLPHTVYASENQVPSLDEYDVSKGFTYMYVKGEPLYAFGHGLSYTTFAYDKIQVEGNPLRVTVEVKNTGTRAGDEVAQLYLQAPNGKAIRPRTMLRGFSRVSLQAGETKQVTFLVNDEKLSFWNAEKKSFELDRGTWSVAVGASSSDLRLRSTFTR